MKVLPIQNNFSVQNQAKTNAQTPSFKGAAVDAAIKEIGTALPSTNKELAVFWAKLFRAVKKEQSLQIVNKELFDSLDNTRPDCLDAFFYRKNIEDKNIKRIDIANDENGRLLSYCKNDDGTFMEINSKDGFRRIGVTYSDGTYRYDFYQDPDIYMDFWPRYTFDDGPLRTTRTRALGGEATTHYDESGNSTIASNVKGFFKDFSDMLHKLKNL